MYSFLILSFLIIAIANLNNGEMVKNGENITLSSSSSYVVLANMLLSVRSKITIAGKKHDPVEQFVVKCTS